MFEVDIIVCDPGIGDASQLCGERTKMCFVGFCRLRCQPYCSCCPCIFLMHMYGYRSRVGDATRCAVSLANGLPKAACEINVKRGAYV